MSHNFDPNVCSTMDQTVGSRPWGQCIIGNIKTLGLLDTGSQVTIIPASLCQKSVIDTTSWLNLKGAGEFNISYCGFIECVIEVEGVMEKNCGVLVRKGEAEVIIGTNVLQHIPG